MHDTAPVHRAKKVSEFLPETNVQVLECLGNFPVLNSIENCWSYMKRKLKNFETISVPLLTEAMRKTWKDDLNVNYFKKLSASLPKRIKMVIKAKAGVTKYK